MNKDSINYYLELAKLFKEKNFSLYIVGGTSRDILLQRETEDVDLATDAKPEEVVKIIGEKNCDETFSKYGMVRAKAKNVKFEITTFRVEGKYDDSRHPSKIKFVSSLKKDYKRRDFTINAIYLDDYFNVYDFCDGKKDLDNKIIRMIGNPKKRIKEDPLRILRAIRFSLILNFEIDKKLRQAMLENKYNLGKIKKEKIIEEINKIQGVDSKRIQEIFNEYGIQYLIDMIE